MEHSVARPEGAQKLPVSVLIQTKNEAASIERCLNALTDFDEVVVVDSNSTDTTVQKALALGVKVVTFTWNGQYPKKKQWQLENVDTRNPWVLFLDADETPSDEMVDSIRQACLSTAPSTLAAFDIDLDYVFAGRLLRHGHRVTKRALVHRERVVFPEVDDLRAPGMGELEGHYQPSATGLVRRLSGRITHHDMDPVSTWFDRHNRYSDWEAYLRKHASIRHDVASRRTLKGRIFDAIPLKPLFFFGYSYILRRGFLDGRAGFDYAIALSLYYWQIGLKVRELEA